MTSNKQKLQYVSAQTSLYSFGWNSVKFNNSSSWCENQICLSYIHWYVIEHRPKAPWEIMFILELNKYSIRLSDPKKAKDFLLCGKCWGVPRKSLPNLFLWMTLILWDVDILQPLRFRHHISLSHGVDKNSVT